MRYFCSAVFMLLLIVATGRTAAADIYVWTDSSGTKHITNYAPPPQAQVLIRTPEIPYDAEADRQRHESERQAQLAREKLALAEREARLVELERQASARIAAAERLNREMAAQQMEPEALSQSQDYSYRTYWYRPGSGYPRGYYRENGNIYYHRPGHHRNEKAQKGHHGRPPHPELRGQTSADADASLHKANTGRVPQTFRRHP